MVVCVNCGLEVATLYHVYNKTNFCLSTCEHCGKIPDKYVEWELPLIIIDLFLFKVEVYRHLIHNYSSRPFVSRYKLGSSTNNYLIKVVLLLFSATILDSYSMLTTCNYLTQPSDFCYPEFESINKNALSKLSTRFSNSYYKTQDRFKFKFEGVGKSLGKESRESVTELVEDLAKSMLYHSRLKIYKRRGLNDEYCVRSYNKVVEILFLMFLQNPALCTLSKNLTADCKDISELGVISLSALRVLSYCLYIALLNAVLRRMGKVKRKSHERCKCNSPELHNFMISYTDIIFSLLICFHIKALVLMMNIWYPRHTILIVIEFYIYLSHIVELHGICNIPLAFSIIIVVTGALLKLAIYFVWFHLLHRFNLSHFVNNNFF